MAQGDLVLLTGGTGHLGFRVLLYAIEHGYQVRAAVRSQAKADILTSNAAFKALNRSSALSTVIVPDFLADNAFDEAVKGVKYIIHVASPLGTAEPEDGDYNKYFIQPAINGTVGVLESAKKVRGVERVVITSSTLAITGSNITDKQYKSTDREEVEKGPFANAFHAYCVSKVAALNATEDWIAKEKPSFDVINIHPGFIFGRDELCDSTKYFQTGTNGVVLAVAAGMADPNMPYPVSYNSVNDTALPHVLALDPKIKGNQSFIVSNSGEPAESWDDISKFVEKEYPEQVKAGIFKKDGPAWKTAPIWKADTSNTENAFGIKMTNLTESTRSVLDHFLELLAKEQGK